MSWLFDGLYDWFKQVLTDAIMASISGMFGMVNEQVTDIAAQVGETPAGWNAGVFTMIRTLSETVVLPIAGVVLTFILCYELIQLIVEKNNLSDFDMFNIFKWIFKSFVAVFILTNTFNIAMGVFDVAQNAINASAGLIVGDLELGNGVMMAIIIFIIVVGRMIEIYLVVSIAPIPFSTMVNRERGQIYT